MSQKVSKKAVVDKTSQADPGFVHPKVWSYIQYFYRQNEQLWQRCTQYERDIAEIRKSLKLVA